MKKYKIKITKKLLNQLKPFWKDLQLLLDEFYSQLDILEKRMESETKIKGIEFFRCDGDYVGIGNVRRTMPLIHDKRLEL